MLLSEINDLKLINYDSKKKQNFLKFSFKMLKKCKSFTLLTTQIVNYASREIFVKMQVLTYFKYLHDKVSMTRRGIEMFTI